MTQLGFGTAPILGRIGRRDALTALNRAFDLGVRHFDTARAYGWGEAEGLLGAFLAERGRAGTTVVTKCGILPPRRSSGLSALKTVGRQVIRRVPALRGLARQVGHSAAFTPTYSYDVTALQASVETSLRDLGGTIDVLLLHSYDAARPGVAEVGRWLEGLVAKGDVRAHGYSITGDLAEGVAHLEREGVLAGAVVQAPVSQAVFDLADRWRANPLIVHSPFTYLGAQPGEDAAAKLGALHKRLAALGDCRALVCSMFGVRHIETNVAAVH